MPLSWLLTIPPVASVAMLYARLAASFLDPGAHRLAALLPVLALLLILPFRIPYCGIRGLAAFFFAWLGVFKLLLLASGHGPLYPSLPPLRFVFTAVLPVKLLRHADVAGNNTSTSHLPLVSSSIKVATMAAIIYLFRNEDKMHCYMSFTLYAIGMYCFLDFFLPCLAAIGNALGMELEPQFDKPYLATSLGDFWGRRWNLMASAILRATVYDPVRGRLGASAGVLATFLVSGLMHEVIAYYMTLRAPTGEVTAFFALHGACVAAERWCTRLVAGRWRLPRAVATPLVLGFVVGTAFWLFFPTFFGRGMQNKYLAEFALLGSSLANAGRKLRHAVGLESTM